MDHLLEVFLKSTVKNLFILYSINWLYWLLLIKQSTAYYQKKIQPIENKDQLVENIPITGTDCKIKQVKI